MITDITYPLGVGLHYNVPANVYHSDPCEKPSLSSSLAVDLVTRAPAIAKSRHPRLAENHTPKPETSEMSLGSVVHELALGRGGGFAVWGGRLNKEGEMDYTWRGKEAAAFWDDATLEGKTPIALPLMNAASAIVKSARKQLDAMGLGYVLEEGESEVVAIWDDGDGHYSRAMYDRWIASRAEIWDIKTTSKCAHPEQLSRSIVSMNYDLRSEFYLMGAEKLTGLPSRKGGLGYQFLFIETEPPYLVVPCYMSDTLRKRGRKQAQDAARIWAECLDSGKWPGYVDQPVEISAPGWVEFEIEQSEGEIAIGGGRIV